MQALMYRCATWLIFSIKICTYILYIYIYIKAFKWQVWLEKRFGQVQQAWEKCDLDALPSCVDVYFNVRACARNLARFKIHI